jgi:hypothetical protein
MPRYKVIIRRTSTFTYDAYTTSTEEAKKIAEERYLDWGEPDYPEEHDYTIDPSVEEVYIISEKERACILRTPAEALLQCVRLDDYDETDPHAGKTQPELAAILIDMLERGFLEMSQVLDLIVDLTVPDEEPPRRPEDFVLPGRSKGVNPRYPDQLGL